MRRNVIFAYSVPRKTLVVDFILLKLKLKNKMLLSPANIFKQRIKEIQKKKERNRN